MVEASSEREGNTNRWLPTKDGSEADNGTPAKTYIISPDWCRKCNLLVSDQIRGSYKAGGWLAVYATKHNSPNEFFHHHYDSVAALAVSASDGCALCTTILATLEHGRVDNSAASESLYQLYHDSHSRRILAIHGTRTRSVIGYAQNAKLEILIESGFSEPPAAVKISKGRPFNQGDFPFGRKVCLDPLSEDCLSLARTWIKECTNLHPHCSRELSSPLPKRILHVAAEPFLYVTNGEVAPYIALSYCWGKKVPLKTTKQNIDIHQKGIPFSSLPRTFQDAVQVVRRLGFKYLWIDALCIVQDDSLDWKTEAAAMGEVYGNSLFTISALESSSCEDGFLQIRSPSHLAFRITKPKDTQAFIRFLRPLRFGGILDSRAWVLQERLMSPATLHYAHDDVGMVWECRSRCVYENGVIQRTDPYVKALEVNHSYLDKKKNLFAQWYYILEDYSNRQLTFSSDRLPAIDGLAQTFTNEQGGLFIAGIWKDDIHRGLLWAMFGRRRDNASDETTPSQSISAPKADFPSWSWASLDCPLSMGSIQGVKRIKDDNFDLVLLDIGPSQRSLTIEGVIRPAIIVPSKFPTEPQMHCYDLDLDTQAYPELSYQGRVPLRAFLDSKLNEGSCSCKLLHVASWHQGTIFSRYSLRYFLLIQETNEGSGEYRRIGVGHVGYRKVSSTHVRHLERKRITLV